VPLEARVWAGTDVGRRRPGNEDHHGSWAADDPATRERLGVLLVVADGMGGSASGEVASRMTVETVIRVVSESSGDDIPGTLLHAIKEANREVHEASLEHPERNGMGTTCTAVLIRGNVAWVGHVGDSRAYLVRGGSIRQLTSDHTLVAELVRRGEITRQQARRDPRRNILTRSVGPQLEVEPEVFRADVPLRAGDAILLCSDGLHGYFNDSELADMIPSEDPSLVVRELIAEANDRGGGDNITALLAYLATAWDESEADLPDVREA
jgi:protein phosphatase